MSTHDSDFCIACRRGDLELAKSELQNIVGAKLYRPIITTAFVVAAELGQDNICNWISELHPFFVFERRRGFTITKVDRTKNF